MVTAPNSPYNQLPGGSDVHIGRPFRSLVRYGFGAAVEVADRVAVPRTDAGVSESSAVGHEPRSRSHVLNRALNLSIAIVALIAIAPVMLLVAFAIRLTSPGPVVYQQVRVGIDRRRRRALPIYNRRSTDFGGQEFTIYKFRSMFVDAEGRTGPVWSSVGDPRITPLGRILRQTRLDELPQLINVIKGDMNIVGPRPERPSIIVDLRERIPEYTLRQRVKPGITGWAQVNQAYYTCLDDVKNKVRLDLEYLRRQSLVEDLKIMVRTIHVMLFKRTGW